MAKSKKKKKASRAKPAKTRTVKAAKAKKPARKATKTKAKAKPAKRPAKKAAAAKKPAPRKAAKARAPKRKTREVLGEGNYTASRRFREEQTGFVKRNKARIASMGQSAEAALEGPEGDTLRAAEQEAASHAHLPEGED